MHMRTNLTCVNKIKAINVNVERVSAFAFTRYRLSHLDIREKKGGESL